MPFLVLGIIALLSQQDVKSIISWSLTPALLLTYCTLEPFLANSVSWGLQNHKRMVSILQMRCQLLTLYNYPGVFQGPALQINDEKQCYVNMFMFIPGRGILRKILLAFGLKEGFPGGSEGKESSCNVGDLDSISELGRSPGGRHENPLQYFCLENSPVTKEPGRLQSVGSQRVRHD